MLGAVTVDITDSSIAKGVTLSNNDDIPLIDLMLMSSAAPSYFEQHEYKDKYYIDGGLAMNSPSMYNFSLMSTI